MTERETEVVVQAMEQYGGSFVCVLARLYRCADPVNRARLEQAFADYFAEYAALVRRPGGAGGPGA